MTGEQANTAFHKALALVKEGKYEEALEVEMLLSDRVVIERRIAERQAERDR